MAWNQPKHRFTFTEKIKLGQKVTSRSNKRPVGAHLQGVEITDLNQGRSGLPVMGRNPRYELIDVSIGNSGSLSNQEWFEDIETQFDAGIAQDVSGSVAFVKFPEGRVRQTISFKIHSADYGFGKEYYDTVPYYDLAKYDSSAYINESGPTGMFPIVGSFPSYDSALQLNGIIEPLEIRGRILGQSLFIPGERQPGAVSGEAPTDNPDYSVDVWEIDARAEFFEDVTTKGLSPSGSFEEASATSAIQFAQSLLEAEYVSDYGRTVFYFVERSQEDLMDHDSGMETQLLSMDPTVDEGTLPNKHVDQTVGWDSKSRDRINSITFRGLLRR